MSRRKAIDLAYRQQLAGISGIRCLEHTGEQKANFSYFPILIGPEYPLSRDELFEKLARAGINGRRYFYPLITDFPMYRSLPSAAPHNLPVAIRAANEVLCLPIYPDLAPDELQEVIDLINDPS
jgi:dTDP-4-amino-4,6-dideoxygalactose transaminase